MVPFLLAIVLEPFNEFFYILISIETTPILHPYSEEHFLTQLLSILATISSSELLNIGEERFANKY